MFTFPVKYGDINSLEDKSRIIISSSIAEKYFGEENPVGEQVTLNYGQDRVATFIIGAVAEKFPETTAIRISGRRRGYPLRPHTPPYVRITYTAVPVAMYYH